MFNIALFGAGRIGQIHAGNAAARADLKLKYIVDPDREAAGALARRTGAAVVDCDAALGEASISGVIIASSTSAHLDQVLLAAAAAKAIFCEKPLDLDLERARAAAPRLETAALLMGFNRRFDPHFQALKTRLDAGEVGRLETLSIISHDPAPPPIGYIRVSGGLFKDMAIHDFDMARWLMGQDPEEVFASASCLIDPAIGGAGDVDTAKTILRSATGRLCVISNSRRSAYGYDQRIEAYGSAGSLRAGNVMVSTVTAWGESGCASDALQNFFLDRYAESYRREMAHFAAILRGETAPAVGYQDAVAALALAEAAGLSAKHNKPVAVRSL
ncbi:MAG TPA: inositol 2-dehydrogenase [Steroidobacteraceae bacterium]|nr:inositol 2-dehydrogenase [Steroidobacteraceae bacterium]